MSNRLNTRVVHCWILSSLFTWSRGIFYSINLVEVNFKYLSKPSEHIKCSKFRRGTGLLLLMDRFYMRHYAGVERGCFPCHVHVSLSHVNATEFHISRFLTLYSLLQMNRNLETYKSLSKCLYYRSTHLLWQRVWIQFGSQYITSYVSKIYCMNIVRSRQRLCYKYL